MNQSLQEQLTQILNTLGKHPSHTDFLWSLLTALIFSAVLFIAYRLANRQEEFSPEFAATLMTLALVSTILMGLIQSNLALSLGMLGSLSLVRFRTNIKDPRDIGFIFWAMAIGIAAATQSYFLGSIGSLILAVLLVFSKRRGERLIPRLLVVQGSQTDLDQLQTVIASQVVGSHVKAKNILSDSFEVVYEVRVPFERENQMIGSLLQLAGIDSVNLLVQKS